ncbi:DNA binding protein Ncp1 [Ustilago sp. UG-2017a]|nr:DNA binding protein Ncp1 [Ustilago sp. UG-2017a]
MTSLARNGSVLVAEIKAAHHAQDANLNGAVPGTATDGGAAPAVDPALTTPQTHSQIANGHAVEPSALNAGTGATVVGHQVDSSIASGGAVFDAAADGAAPGLIQPQTCPIQPIQPGERALQPSHINTAVPAAGAGAPVSATGSAISGGAVAPGTAPGSFISATSPDAPAQQAPVAAAAQPTHQQQLNAVAPAGAPAVVAHPAPTSVAAVEPPKSALSPKEIKKMDKLMKTEAKNEHKSLKRAIKDATSSEKLFRKSRDAESQALKRHQKAQTYEHKAAKALSKAKSEHEKYAAELAKAVEDLDIKKRHTESTREGYEKAKKHIDELRNQKTVNDQARSRQAAQLHGPR